MMRQDSVVTEQGPVIIQNAPGNSNPAGSDYFRRLPTVTEPPLAEPVGTPKIVPPSTLRSAPKRPRWPRRRSRRRRPRSSR